MRQNKEVIERCGECIEKNKGTLDIKVGDSVRIRAGGYCPGEYMWVIVTGVRGEKLEGLAGSSYYVSGKRKILAYTIMFDKGDVCGKGSE